MNRVKVKAVNYPCNLRHLYDDLEIGEAAIVFSNGCFTGDITNAIFRAGLQIEDHGSYIDNYDGDTFIEQIHKPSYLVRKTISTINYYVTYDENRVYLEANRLKQVKNSTRGLYE